jgi:hypothetical protein
MHDTTLALATLIFAAMAGVGSVVRVLQNYSFHKWHKKQAKKKRK